MHVAVAIVGFRNPDDIARCLEALERSQHTDFEVVICENGGADAHARLQAALPAALAGGQPITLVLGPGNPGFAGGVNICLYQTPAADAWWVLNPDTSPEPQALAALVERLADGSCEAAGGPMHLPSGQIQSFGGRWQAGLARSISIGHGRPLDAAVDPAAITREQNYLNGASMLIGRHFLKVAGPMREDYFLYCEEVEWCLRALSLGLRLGFAPEGRVLHYHGTTTGAGGGGVNRSRLAVYLGERNRVLLTRDRFGALLPVAAFSALLLLIWRSVRAGAWRQIGQGLAGWRDGLLNRRGAPDWA